MNRVKTFDATGTAPNGKLYAGDLNSIQDAVAALVDFAQTIDLGTVRVGETGLTLTRYGAAEAQLAGSLRVTKILRGLEGMLAGSFTTAQRDAISAGSRPLSMIIFNLTNNRLEINLGSDAVPNWQPVSTVIGADSITSVELAPSSVTTTELAANAVQPGDAKLDSAETWNFLGTLQSKSMRVHRHPYGNDRHIESGSGNVDGSGFLAITFTDAFGANPKVVCTPDVGPNLPGVISVSTTGATLKSVNSSYSNAGNGLHWIAEGQD